ncbi:hypothetical protein IAI40_12175, partial [Streptococcus pseudopneumoniae]|nr:hypothetical protein [Streptococcus pseudopneumoniae]
DEQFPQHHGQVYAQEQGKEHAPLLWWDGNLQEEELGRASLVLRHHTMLLYAGDEEGL